MDRQIGATSAATQASRQIQYSLDYTPHLTCDIPGGAGVVRNTLFSLPNTNRPWMSGRQWMDGIKMNVLVSVRDSVRLTN